MYTDVVDRPRELRRRHSVENQWDLLDGTRRGRADAGGQSRGDAGRSRRRRRAVDERLAAAGVDAGRRSRGDSRQRQLAVPPLAAALVRRDGRRARVAGRAPRDRDLRAIGTRGGGRHHQRRPRHSCRRAIGTACSTAATFRSAELRALLERSARVHRRRQRPAAPRGDDARADRRDLRTDAVGALRAVARSRVARPSSIEIDGLPCRPCDQRVCEPGDFRCLTRIDAPRVIAAAERLLAARRRLARSRRARDAGDRRRADALRRAGVRTARARCTARPRSRC